MSREEVVRRLRIDTNGSSPHFLEKKLRNMRNLGSSKGTISHMTSTGSASDMPQT